MALRRWLGSLFRRPQLEADIAEEVDYHLERLEEEERARGLDRQAAQAAARQRFGNPSVVRARTHDVVLTSRMDGLWRDLQLAWRSLLRDRLTTVAVTVCLGLGIGVTTAFYGLLDALLVHDVTAREPDRLVRFSDVSYPVWREIADSQIFDTLASGGQCATPVRWREGDHRRAVVANCLSANFWDVIGTTPRTGRVWTAAEAAAETNPHLVVVSHRFWRRMGGRDDILGQTVVLNDAPYTVLGVLPDTYKAIQGYGITPDVYLPINTDLHPRLLERDAGPRDRMQPVGRLHQSWSRERTRDALAALLAVVRTGDVPSPPPVQLTAVSGVAKYGADGFDHTVLTLSALVSGLAALFLAIACANAAGMLLARSSQRVQQLCLCRALGATSWHLMRRQLIESAVVAVLGTVAGVGIVYLASRVSSTIAVPVQDVMITLTFGPDWRLLLISAGLGSVSALVTGFAPALMTRRTALSHMGARASLSRPRLRTWLLGAQVCLSAVLLLVTYIGWQNTRTVEGHSPGFDTAHIVWLDIVLDRRLPPSELARRQDRIYQALQSHPGVSAASWSWYLPFQVAFAEPTIRSAPAETALEIKAIEQGIGPRYFATMRVPLLEGREFSQVDLTAALAGAASVVLNRTSAQALFPSRSAVGERVWRAVPGGEPIPLTVIGVTADTTFRSPGEAPPAMLHSLTPRTASFVVNAATPGPTLIPELSRVIDAAVPGAAAGGYTLAERYANAVFPARAVAVLLGSFAALGVILTLVALIGLVSYNAARRRQEIGIRVALGASAAGVMALMLAEHLGAVAVGAVVGCVIAIAWGIRVSHLMADGVALLDPVGVMLVIALLSSSATCVVLLLARRAAHASPVVALAKE